MPEEDHRNSESGAHQPEQAKVIHSSHVPVLLPIHAGNYFQLNCCDPLQRRKIYSLSIPLRGSANVTQEHDRNTTVRVHLGKRIQVSSVSSFRIYNVRAFSKTFLL